VYVSEGEKSLPSLAETPPANQFLLQESSFGRDTESGMGTCYLCPSRMGEKKRAVVSKRRSAPSFKKGRGFPGFPLSGGSRKEEKEVLCGESATAQVSDLLPGVRREEKKKRETLSTRR